MSNADLRPTLITGTQIWASSESVAHACLISDPFVRSVVCLRRTLPDWWIALRDELKNKIAFHHLPTPDIFDGDMGEAIVRVVFDLLPKLEAPVLVFCLRGRNRTGVFAGYLRFQVTRDVGAAVLEYRRRASLGYRKEEVALLRSLCCLRHQ